MFLRQLTPAAGAARAAVAAKKHRQQEDKGSGNGSANEGSGGDKNVTAGNGTSKTASDAPVITKAADVSNTTAPTHPAFLPARFSGKFDLYSTNLPFLRSQYLPSGAQTPNFAAVYTKILFFQAKPDFSARIALRDEPADGGGFACADISNPMSDEPIEPIFLVDARVGDDVAFSAQETAHASTVGSGLGYAATMELDTSGDDHGMVTAGHGDFKMRKVWDGGDGKELFEGYCTLNLTYGPLLRRKGHGSFGNAIVGFWAVRALKDEAGNEIGIEADTCVMSGAI
ncbi:hypothetical protein FA95DRAFT_1543607 [Auriscalpium vulgare]|uniref:Uncharacterized protein n=1 Tax=Auriscalpium vulgare TaxID=40419 RepID=A0ACB8RNV2_9AGAM|nr:hypothetical protein FA95DRAFT_1543607 [Auriscalpium vulgare]